MAVLSLRIAILRLFRRFKKDGIKTSSERRKSAVCNNATSDRKSLQKFADDIAAEFKFSSEDVNRAVEIFVTQLNDGLKVSGSMMEQIPSYVTAVPIGSEIGTYLAVDLGGTNIRVCSVALNGDGTYAVIQSKVVIPANVMVCTTSADLFNFVAKQIETFLQDHHAQSLDGWRQDSNADNTFCLGFTFSHAVTQHGINSGVLIRWSKGFCIDDAVGKDVCALLQDAICELNLPVKVTALVNDTVGTLMARAYTSPQNTKTVLGAVFGTGTNGAYIEKLPSITKLAETEDIYDSSASHMIVNTEWGNFDSQLNVLPNTTYDIALDRGSVNPGFEMYEKRISGMYLGELLRLALLSLISSPARRLFASSTMPSNSPLYTQWGIDSEILSLIKGDHDVKLEETRSHISNIFGIPEISVEAAEAIKTISDAIGRRSARLSAVAIGAVVLQTGCLEAEEDSIVDIGVDGSLIEFYPGFEEALREALACIEGIGSAGEKRIHIAVAKDGSGVGAALTAHMAAS